MPNITTTNKIPYPQALNTAFAVCTTAKTTETDLTNAVLLYTAPTNGAIITKFLAHPRATVTACRLKVYVCKSSAPTTPYMITTKLMSAATVNETTAISPVDLGASESAPIKLAPGDLVYVAIGVSQSNGVIFVAEMEEFG